MSFRVERRANGGRGRAVLTGMVVSTKVLSRVAPKWEKDEGLFASKWENVVGRWCVRHYQKFGKAPGKQIIHLYEAWAEKADPDTAALVQDYLASLSQEFADKGGKVNADVVLDLAGEHFNRVRAARVADRAKELLDEGKTKEALEVMAKVDAVEVADQDGVSVLDDLSVLKAAFGRTRDPIVRYPGAMDRFMGPAMERDSFVSFMAPEKKGKSQFLLDVAWWALRSRCRVAFFAVGDMSLDQMTDRIAMRAARHPLVSPTGEWPCTVRVPTRIDEEMDDQGKNRRVARYEEKTFEAPLTLEKAEKAYTRFREKFVGGKDRFRMFVYPNNTVTAAGVGSVLETLARKGEPADVVIIDYADLLAPPPGYMESRDATNATWKTLRSISQKYHNLVVTATQAKATSYKSVSLEMSDFSEDKRKLAHVTGMIGINQTEREKEDGLYRLNWVVRRNAPFLSTNYVYTAPCLAFADPCVVSSF